MSRITIPDTSKNRDAGITYKHGIAYARYTENGKQVRRKIGGEVEVHQDLRAARDELYKILLAAGAKVASKKGPKPGDLNAKRRLRVAADPMKYIRFEERLKLPWSVRFGRQVAGRYLTLGEAQMARDRAVKTNAQAMASADTQTSKANGNS